MEGTCPGVGRSTAQERKEGRVAQEALALHSQCRELGQPEAELRHLPSCQRQEVAKASLSGEQ